MITSYNQEWNINKIRKRLMMSNLWGNKRYHTLMVKINENGHKEAKLKKWMSRRKIRHLNQKGKDRNFSWKTSKIQWIPTSDTPSSKIQNSPSVMTYIAVLSSSSTIRIHTKQLIINCGIWVTRLCMDSTPWISTMRVGVLFYEIIWAVFGRFR